MKNIPARTPTLILAMTVLLATGCATSHVRDPAHPRQRQVASDFYPATAHDMKVMGWAARGSHLQLAHPIISGNYWCLTPFVVVGALLDLPFSLLFDTIFLPADISRHREMKKNEEADKSSEGSREGRKQPRGASSALFEDKMKQE